MRDKRHIQKRILNSLQSADVQNDDGTARLDCNKSTRQGTKSTRHATEGLRPSLIHQGRVVVTMTERLEGGAEPGVFIITLPVGVVGDRRRALGVMMRFTDAVNGGEPCMARVGTTEGGCCMDPMAGACTLTLVIIGSLGSGSCDKRDIGLKPSAAM